MKLVFGIAIFLSSSLVHSLAQDIAPCRIWIGDPCKHSKQCQSLRCENNGTALACAPAGSGNLCNMADGSDCITGICSYNGPISVCASDDGTQSLLGYCIPSNGGKCYADGDCLDGFRCSPPEDGAIPYGGTCVSP